MSKIKPVPIADLLERLYEGLPDYTILADALQAQISTCITAERIARNLNQSNFAELMGVTQSQISKWENGDFNFTIEKLCEIASKLDLDLNITLKKKQAIQKITNGKITYVSFSGGSTAWRAGTKDEVSDAYELKEM